MGRGLQLNPSLIWKCISFLPCIERVILFIIITPGDQFINYALFREMFKVNVISWWCYIMVTYSWVTFGCNAFTMYILKQKMLRMINKAICLCMCWWGEVGESSSCLSSDCSTLGSLLIQRISKTYWEYCKKWDDWLIGKYLKKD